MHRNAPTAKPFLRWAGSKRQLLPKLKRYWRADFKRYVEPFMGSACLFFALRPASALLADLNEELVQTFIQVRDRPGPVSKKLHAYPVGEEAYYDIRGLRPPDLSPVAAAARFIYLNRFCFNALFRTNRQGHFNVPFASSGTGGLPSRELLEQCSRLLLRADIKSCDFADTVADVQPGDFVYMDPPFAVRRRRVFREYSPEPFGELDLARLTETLEHIHSAGATFVVSYADSREGREALSKWRPTRVRTKRNIAGFSEHRRHAYEILATNLEEEMIGEPPPPGGARHGRAWTGRGE